MMNVALERRNIDNQIWPLTFEQERQWFLEQLNPGTSAFNRPCIMKLTGILDVKMLERCVNEIIRRHEVLRACFPVQAGVPCQVIRPFQYMELSVADLSHLPELKRKSEMDQRIMDEVCHPFDLSGDFLFRAALLRLSSEEHLLIINIHHIVFDGWSMQNLLMELSRLYRGFLKEQTFTLPDLPLQYQNYAAKQRETIAEELLERDLAYWKRQLGGELPELNLPIDLSRPAQSNLEGKACCFTIPSNMNQRIKSLCRQEKATPFMLITTVLKILLHRYTGQEDLIVGSLVSGRTHSSMEPLIGLFANTLVMRTQLQAELAFREALQKVRKVTLEGYQYQNLPFAKLVAEVSPKRSPNTNPFFQVMLNMHNMLQTNENVPGLLIEEVDIEHYPALVDLTLRVAEVQEELKCSFIYNKDIFEEGTITRMAGHFITLLEGALTEPETPIARLPLLTLQERHELLVEWNGAKADYPRDSCIHQLFEEQVDLHPNDAAVIFEETPITYDELDKRANQIANYLRESGLVEEQLVAVCLERSPEIIVNFIGILKAGGAYVPIDISYPAERIAFMLNDANVSFIITTEAVAKQLPQTSAKVLYLDKEAAAVSAQSENRPVNRSRPENLAYVMYTSGSTGKPKGAAIAQRGIIRLVKNISFASLGPQESFLNLSSLAFDGSAFEIYGSLLNGGKLVIMNSHKPSLEQIAETIKKQSVTSISVTPEMLNLLLEDYSGSLGSLRQIISGGDVLAVWLARKCLAKLPECQLINGYGPTENTVYSTTFPVKQILADTTTIPIGRPIADDKVFILDQYLQPVPIGVSGELYVSGDGLARGYLNKDDLTRERFLNAPFLVTTKGKLYRTGDLVRYRTDRNIEFIGRVDHQVKIRGCRIELGEIETAVGQFPGVRQIAAGAIKGKSGTSDLAVYVVMQKGVSFDSKKLRAFTRERLPDYMIPTFFIELPEIPVTPVGKIDRKRLPIPVLSSGAEQIVLPRNRIEEQLAQIWGELLAIQPISVTDNFFDLGGHSLLAMRMFSDIEKKFRKRLPVSIIFQEDTIEKLAELLSLDDQITDMSSSLVPIQPLGSKPPLFCIHAIGGEVLSYRSLALELGIERPVYGLRYTKSENDTRISIEELAAKYVKEIRKIQPDEPYFLLGYSLGGAIAYEIAHQLYQAGKEVSLLTILDTRNPERYPMEIETETPYMKIMTNNMKILYKLPAKQKMSFIKKKLQNALQLINSRAPLSSQNGAERANHFMKALKAYKPKPYPGKMLLIRANDNTNNNNVDEKLGWEAIEAGSIHVHGIPGDHGTLIKEPHVKYVVNCLKEYLETVKP